MSVDDIAKQVAIEKYNGSSKNIIIPSTIGTAIVTSIEDYAFKYCKSINSIIIPI